MQNSVRVSSDITDLAEILTELAYNNDIYNIKVRAPYAVTSEITRQIAKIESSTYSENKIKVEGI